MNRKERLLNRLDNLGSVLEGKEGARWLLGLGSVGKETDRIDDYSDLDFFLMVRDGEKKRFLERLDWLEDTYPLAYSFMNTADGFKILFEDGIYGEFAVFEEWELAKIGFNKGRLVWKASDAVLDEALLKPAVPLPVARRDSLDYPLNEALTNLYVGLCRFARGEKLSAMRFVESYAIDSILSVLHLVEQEVDAFPDPFGLERRLEVRFPQFASSLGGMMQGYDRVPESALQILVFLESVFPVNARMSHEIRSLAAR